MSMSALLVLPVCVYAFLYITIRLGYYFDWAAKPMAKLWYFLQSTCGIAMFGLPIGDRGIQDVQFMLNTYGNLFYWIMLYDVERMTAYRAGLKETSAGRTFLDIGTGKHMPLARLALQNGAHRAVAIEGNPDSYKHAKGIKDSHPELKEKLKLIHGISTDVQLSEENKPDAFVHELIGTIASDEGLPKFVLDARRRFLSAESPVVPQRVATLAVPVQDPVPCTGFKDSFVSTLFGGVAGMIKTPDAQCICNPPLKSHTGAPMYLSEPQECESWVCTEENLKQKTVTEFRVSQDGFFSGFYMAPLAELGSTGHLDALHNITSWGVMFIRTLTKPVPVKGGDTIKMHFAVNCEPALPHFDVSVEITRQGDEVRNGGKVAWMGPGLIVGKKLW